METVSGIFNHARMLSKPLQRLRSQGIANDRIAVLDTWHD